MHLRLRRSVFFGLIAVCLLAASQGISAGEQNAGVQSRTFHVDAASGDDERDGLAPERAWRSLGKVNAMTLLPGDNVLFRRGQIWRGQLVPQNGRADAVITYGAFGEGSKPRLLGSAAVNRPEDWQEVSKGIWATVPVRFEPAAPEVALDRAGWSMHQEGGAACALSRIAGENNGAGFRLDCTQPGTQGNHIQFSATGIRLRADNYYLLSFRARATKPFTAGRFALMRNGPPYTSYADTESASIRIGTEWADHTVRFRAKQTANNSRLAWYLGGSLPSGASLDVQPGELVEARCNQPIPLTVDVGNVIFDDGLATGVKKWSEAELHHDGDYFYDARTWQVKLRSDGDPATRHRSIELALRKHLIDQRNRGYVAYENLDLRYGAAHGIGGANTRHITVRDCDISFIGGGHQHTPPNGKPVRFGNGIEFWSDACDCLVEGCRLWEIYDAALTNQGDGANVQEDITYRRNVIWNCEYSFEFWNRGAASRTRNIRFEHNTCVNAGYGWGHGQRPDPNGRHLMFYDNTSATEGFFIRYNIFSGAKDSCLRLHGRDWTEALVMDHNCWFQPQGALLLWGKERIGPDAFEAFQKKRGFDTHSLLADPKFVGPAEQDYRLSPGSPARVLLDQGMPAGARP